MTTAPLVIGEALVDIIDAGADLVVRPGGSPANVAVGLSRLGTPAELLAALSTDEHGIAIRSWLDESGVSVHPKAFALENSSSARATIDTTGAATYEFDIRWVVNTPEQQDLAERPLVHVGSLAVYLQPGADNVAELVRTATHAGTPVSVDANARPAILGDPEVARDQFEDVAAQATVIKLSDEDCEYLYPAHGVDQVMRRLLGLGNRVRAVVVTLGGEGAQFLTPTAGGTVDAPRVEVADTIGAGDSFMSAFLSVLLTHDVEEWSSTAVVRTATEFAVLCAAVTVSRQGANPPWKKEVTAS